MNRLPNNAGESLEYDIEKVNYLKREVSNIEKHIGILQRCIIVLDSSQNNVSLTKSDTSIVNEARDFFVHFRNPDVRKTMSFHEVETKIEHLSSSLQNLIIRTEGHQFFNEKIVEATRITSR